MKKYEGAAVAMRFGGLSVVEGALRWQFHRRGA